MNPSRRQAIAFVVAAIVCPAAPLAAQTAALPSRSSDGGGVRVVVKPKTVGVGPVWEFDVIMDTHSTPLNADLVKTAVLIDGGGKRYQPTGWKGDPPGGHHREGLLSFPVPATSSGTFEIQIEGMGPAKRSFRWTAK